MDREQEWVEMPQIHIPDEVSHVDSPEIGIDTPHPDPGDSPNASYSEMDDGS
jgi:hypothetical protein